MRLTKALLYQLSYVGVQDRKTAKPNKTKPFDDGFTINRSGNRMQADAELEIGFHPAREFSKLRP